MYITFLLYCIAMALGPSIWSQAHLCRYKANAIDGTFEFGIREGKHEIIGLLKKFVIDEFFD